MKLTLFAPALLATLAATRPLPDSEVLALVPRDPTPSPGFGNVIAACARKIWEPCYNAAISTANSAVYAGDAVAERGKKVDKWATKTNSKPLKKIDRGRRQRKKEQQKHKYSSSDDD